MLYRSHRNSKNASKDVRLEVSIEKTKYTLISRHQNAGQDHNMTVINRSFEKVAIRYFGIIAINKNMTREEIKKRLYFG
jgi:UDP-N-acetylglucosamine 2-epimerase